MTLDECIKFRNELVTNKIFSFDITWSVYNCNLVVTAHMAGEPVLSKQTVPFLNKMAAQYLQQLAFYIGLIDAQTKVHKPAVFNKIQKTWSILYEEFDVDVIASVKALTGNSWNMWLNIDGGDSSNTIQYLSLRDV